MKRLSMLALLVCVMTAGATLRAQTLLIRGAQVHTVTARGTLEHADVLVRDGKIAAVDAGLSAPSGATVIDAKGRALTPGLFAGLADIGVVEVMAEASTNDTGVDFSAPAWQQQWRPELDLSLAFNPRSTVLAVSRIEGLTWTMLAPWSGDGLIAGQGSAVTLDGRYDAVLDGSRSLFVSWTDTHVAGGSRAAMYMLFEQAVDETRLKGPMGAGMLLHPAGRVTLRKYLDGGRVVFEVERAADIRRVIELARRNGMKPVIAGGAEAWVVASELASAQVPVILNTFDDLPDTFDQLGARLDNAALLHQAGVKIAFTSGHIHNARVIRQVAGIAVAHGLPWDVALAAITATPADIFGLGASRGRIAAGQVADLVLWSGDPLEVTTVADQVWIAGRAVEMRSRQTELRDRYARRLAPLPPNNPEPR